MHDHDDLDHLGEPTVPVLFILENPEELNEDGSSQAEHQLTAPKGANLLDVALAHHINLEHACGGVCACSTCHIYVDQGMDALAEATEPEDDRVEEAPGIELNSRLACQCEITGDGPIVVRIPAWNRNAVKEVPH